MATSTPGLGTSGRATSVHAEVMDPYATMGQFSLAPATKTTIVTTTYTTTTTFPPLCLNAPGSLGGRDPKEYPLAHVQAPDSIRKIYFDAGGELACFEEADAATNKVHEVCFSDPREVAYRMGRSCWRRSCVNRPN
jgi:F-box and WD-40 domain protein CDC4